jgi:TetR/AcrR family transcriptional repressor of nem operon
MGRSSRWKADFNRETIVAGASRVFRARGVEKSGIAEIMKDAGLTHGAFYSHFESKDMLAAEACAYVFNAVNEKWNAQLDHAGRGNGDVREQVLARYLSAAHRDDAGSGCPGAALASDAIHDEEGGAFRAAYGAGMGGMAAAVERMMPKTLSKKARRQRALLTVATLLGAMTIARATQGAAFSDEVLEAARAGLLGSAR